MKKKAAKKGCLGEQRVMEFVGHGGKRPGAGRKLARGVRATPSHRRREHDWNKPSHTTLRVVGGIPSLRERSLYMVIEEAIRAGNDRFGFRVCGFSVQGNHIHLLTEADTRVASMRGMQGLVIRIAKAINRHLGRRGKVFAERYHSRTLSSPTEVRNCVVYVLNNAKHHAKDRGAAWPRKLVDPFSSATWFDGWTEPIETRRLPGPSPTVDAETWLLRKGWKKLGLIAPWEKPKETKPRRAA